MPTRRLTLAGLLLAGALPGAQAQNVAKPWPASRALPPLAGTDLQGKAWDLAALRGRAVLVNFWATWCPYCRHEMPAMETFYRENRARGFEIVAYSLDKTQAEADAYLREAGYSFPAPLMSAQVSQAFGGVDRIPLSFVIDRDGVIRHRIAGQVHAGRLDDLITPLLATSASVGSR